MLVSADTSTTDIPQAAIDGPPLEYRGRRVLTTGRAATAFGVEEKLIQSNFSRNSIRFRAGVHFFKIARAELRSLKNEPSFSGFVGKNASQLILWTDRGIARHAKILETDTAWEIYEQLEEAYFAIEAAAPARLPTTAEAFANVFQMVADQERRQTDHEQRIEAITADVQLIKDTAPLTAKPQNTETITEARKRIGRKFGLPARIINIVMGDLAYSPRAFAMVKNSHEDAKGSSFAVWRIIDVTKLFARFVGECTMVTAQQATHPDIEGRFKLVRQNE